MYVCKAGHMEIRKARTGKKGINENQKDTFMFDIEKCKVCPMRDGYNVASSSGLIGMQMQGAMAMFSVNLKRIITLMKESK